MLHINDLVFRQGGRLLFDQTTVHVAPGQKVGLVGRNGAGKSTLFRLILGGATPDSGEITIRARARVGTVSQEMPDGGSSPLDFVLNADRERSDLLEEAETCTDPYRIGEIHERLAAIDAHTAPARASSILAGLGFNADSQERPLSSFSGGWRMRVALAATLFQRPDILFLDEPTNHLDLEATLWLQSYLASWQGTLVVISHDREILNEVANRIVHLDSSAKLVAYGGNYDTFERTRREKMELAAKTQSKELEQRRKIQSFIDRFRAKATKAAQAQSRIKMLEKMGPVTSVVEEHSVTFDFPSPEPLAPPILTIEDATVGYGTQVILSNLSFRIDMDDRIALLGANGNGKSTLAKVLAGRLDLMTGRTQRSSKLKIGYFSQDQADELNMGATAFDHMAKALPNLPQAKVRAHLGRFGFEKARADQKIDSLSGGEKARLLFALMSRDAPHLLILDEPTNHLDIDSREALVSALNAYEGAVILISHDPRLVELVADSLWLVDAGKVQSFDGDLADYRRFLLDKAARERRSSGGSGGNGGGAEPARSNASRKDERRAAAEARAQLAPLKRKVDAAEKMLAQLNEKKSAIDNMMANPGLYGQAPDNLTKLGKEQADIERQLGQAELQWLEASEAYEAAKNA